MVRPLPELGPACRLTEVSLEEDGSLAGSLPQPLLVSVGSSLLMLGLPSSPSDFSPSASSLLSVGKDVTKWYLSTSAFLHFSMLLERHVARPSPLGPEC